MRYVLGWGVQCCFRDRKEEGVWELELVGWFKGEVKEGEEEEEGGRGTVMGKGGEVEVWKPVAQIRTSKGFVVVVFVFDFSVVVSWVSVWNCDCDCEVWEVWEVWEGVVVVE